MIVLTLETAMRSSESRAGAWLIFGEGVSYSVFLPHEQQVFWEFYLKWFYVLLVCSTLFPSPPLMQLGGGSELNCESCPASTGEVQSCAADTRLMRGVASFLFKYSLFFLTVQAHHQQQL